MTRAYLNLADSVRAMPSARAAAASQWSPQAVSSIASIAIAAFSVLYFAWQFVR
jgi:hypothetical protein